jgi:hypothetical protein
MREVEGRRGETHSSVVSITLLLSVSARARAPSLPMSLPQRLCVHSWERKKERKERKKERKKERPSECVLRTENEMDRVNIREIHQYRAAL